MYEASVVVSLLIMVLASFDYVRRAWVRETSPVLATWILMNAVMGLSFWMYWESPSRSWTSNIGVVGGLVNITTILCGLVVIHLRDQTLSVAFDRVQRWCLALGGVVVLFWFATRQPLAAYVLLQCVALIAYFATVKKLWHAPGSTEPYTLWVAVFLGTLCAIYPAWAKQDIFAWVYLGRAVPSTAFVIWLIRRAKNRGMRAGLEARA